MLYIVPGRRSVSGFRALIYYAAQVNGAFRAPARIQRCVVLTVLSEQSKVKDLIVQD